MGSVLEIGTREVWHSDRVDREGEVRCTGTFGLSYRDPCSLSEPSALSRMKQGGQASVPYGDHEGEGASVGRGRSLRLKAMPGEGCFSELSATNAISSWGSECFTPDVGVGRGRV